MSSHDPQPSITIVVPFFNRQAEVVRCIEAVKQQAVPEGVTFEIVAVDNNSSDGTGEVIAGDGVRVVHCERRGPAAARNAGITAARGAIVAMTDSDCVPRPTWLHQLVEPFSDPAVLAAGGRIMALHVGSGPAFFAEDFQVLSQEQRTERMLRAEEKAGRLPATMTVPMMLFILPALFIVLIGPAVLGIMDNYIGVGN